MDCPFEWLTLDGQSLFGRLFVERHSPALFDPCLPLIPEREIAVLNLLASNEPIQPADALANGSVRIYDGLAAVEQWLAETDLSQVGVLVVVAHGTERDGERPFRLPDGRPWSLPLTYGLPPLVILVACGNDAGNLLFDGQRLLSAGATSVLAPLGRPCPAAAGEFLATFAQAWRTGRRLDAILTDAQRPASAARGARLLRVLGRGDLRTSDLPELTEFSDTALVAAVRCGEDAALTVLIDRLTLRTLQQDFKLDQTERRLRDWLEIGRGDETGERWLGERLDSVSETLWPLSRAWIVPLEMQLAEAHDHHRLPRLEATCSKLGYGELQMPPTFHHYWSKLYYRSGRYALALHEVAQGLSRLGVDKPCEQGAGLLGQLLALLIDMDLPAPAAVLHQWLDEALARRTDVDVAWERHKLRDRAARIALRQGQIERAVTLYRLKRTESARFKGNGYRELAWLLYIESWRDPHGAAIPLAHEVESWLDGIEVLNPEPGNADALYLLRAYAAWAWCSQQSAAIERLERFIPMLEARLFSGDAGPPGFVFAYLHLCRRDGMPGTQPPPWDAIATVLEEQRYFLELAAFTALLGERGMAIRLLDRVVAQRVWHRPFAFPKWLEDAGLLDWEALVAERVRVERQALGGESVSPETLLVSGLLPL
ncbi:hypothetical protein CKO25_12605 [Thiocapsa imhoffii]|uniref:CHAT domain-containing protein n=1 Tax=Thiocapsa imhoffii TaxID=382777 RepID=A0A9X1B9M7_9GAMM|nr:hypothetical protein [Thiocapsa imhoffii]